MWALTIIYYSQNSAFPLYIYSLCRGPSTPPTLPYHPAVPEAILLSPIKLPAYLWSRGENQCIWRRLEDRNEPRLQETTAP